MKTSSETCLLAKRYKYDAPGWLRYVHLTFLADAAELMISFSASGIKFVNHETGTAFQTSLMIKQDYRVFAGLRPLVWIRQGSSRQFSAGGSHTGKPLEPAASTLSPQSACWTQPQHAHTHTK